MQTVRQPEFDRRYTKGEPLAPVSTPDGAIRVAIAAQTSTAPSSAAVITAAADITLAAGERLFVQNLGTNPLFIRRATGATTSAFHYVLQAAGTNDDGTGGSISITDHTGVVSFAGTSVRYIAWKV